MRLREPFAKKHVHIWKNATPPVPSGPQYDSWGFEISAPLSGDLVRICEDCGARQVASYSDPGVSEELQGLPQSVWHLADIRWR